MIQETLLSIGFSQKEVDIYLILVESGALKAGEIAKKTNINRTTIYDIVDSLMEKGLISKFQKGSKTYFEALAPSKLLGYVDREVEDKVENLKKQRKKIEELLPEFVSRANKGSSRPKVTFFEGEKGLREAYEDTLTAKDRIDAYANVETMHEGLPNFFPNYYKRRVKNKVPIRAIMPNNELSQNRKSQDQTELRISKILPEGDTFTPEVNIYNDKVLIASWKEKMAVIIQSQEFADFQRTIYERLWKKLS